MELSITVVVLDYRFQRSHPQRLPMAAIIEKKKARGDDGKKEKVRGGQRPGRPRFLSSPFPSSPMRSLFFSFSLSPSHITGISISTTRKAKHCQR